MRVAHLKIARSEDSTGARHWQEFEVPWEPRSSVLEALHYVARQLDPTLAFRYGCRYKKCGLCAMLISGRPRLACTVRLQEETVLEPLTNLRVIRDLAIDRRPFFDALRRHILFVARGAAMPGKPDRLDAFLRVAGCLECLCCHAMCPRIAEDVSFAGPFLFVKLAQMHYHPADSLDRSSQAKEMGIERCRGCGLCFCPYGIPIQRDVIKPFLGDHAGAARTE